MTDESNNLPTNWEEQLGALAKASATEVRATSSNLSFRGGVMSYEGQPVPGNTLNLIVLGYCHEHTFYAERYDPNNVRPPSCFALNLHKDDMVPAEDVVDPVNADCASCPNLKWGSDPDGGRGKACQERYRLVCIPTNVLQEPADGGNHEEVILAAEVATAKLPVTSGKNWANYLTTITSMYQRPEWAVVTKMTVVPDAKRQFAVTFEVVEPVNFADNPMLFSALQRKREMAQAQLLKPYDLSGEANDTAAPAPKKGTKAGR